MSCVYVLVYISCYMFLLINLEKNCSSLVLIVYFYISYRFFFLLKYVLNFSSQLCWKRQIA